MKPQNEKFKIRDKNGTHVLSMLETTLGYDVWKCRDASRSSWNNIATIVRKVATVYFANIPDKYRKDFIGVHNDLFTYRRKLGIKAIRAEITERKKTKYGMKLSVKYGYIYRKNMKKLSISRKVKHQPWEEIDRYLLLKKTDFTFKAD